MVVKPVSMPCRCSRLRTASVAAIINTNDSATCPATSPLRRRPAVAPEAPSPERRTNNGTAAATDNRTVETTAAQTTAPMVRP